MTSKEKLIEFLESADIKYKENQHSADYFEVITYNVEYNFNAKGEYLFEKHFEPEELF